jgi:hypothetical protein
MWPPETQPGCDPFAFTFFPEASPTYAKKLKARAALWNLDDFITQLGVSPELKG